MLFRSQLANLPGTAVLGVSALFETAPWQAQGPVFHNAVAAVDTALGPHELLQALLAIEAVHGRERPYVNAPRTLDLDLLAHGGAQLATRTLTLPHPRAHERAFVLGPWLELAARMAPDPRLPALPEASAVAALCLAQQARQVAAADWAQGF